MFTEKIKELCNRSGVSIDTLAEEIGMTPKGLQSAMDNNSLKVKTIVQIAALLQKPIAYFFAEGEEPDDYSTFVGFDEPRLEVLMAYIDNLSERGNELIESYVQFFGMKPKKADILDLYSQKEADYYLKMKYVTLYNISFIGIKTEKLIREGFLDIPDSKPLEVSLQNFRNAVNTSPVKNTYIGDITVCKQHIKWMDICFGSDDVCFFSKEQYEDEVLNYYRNAPFTKYVKGDKERFLLNSIRLFCAGANQLAQLGFGIAPKDIPKYISMVCEYKVVNGSCLFTPKFKIEAALERLQNSTIPTLSEEEMQLNEAASKLPLFSDRYDRHYE